MIRLSTIHGVLRTLVEAPAQEAQDHQHHPHTALIVIAHSAQVYSSASTLPSPSQITQHTNKQNKLPNNGLFVPQPPPSTHTHTQEDEEGEDQLALSKVIPSLVGDERIRVLAGFATLLWREELMSDNPAVPLIASTELGLILVQPLTAGGSAAGTPFSTPNSPQQEDHFQHQHQHLYSATHSADTSTTTNTDGTLQQAQRRRAFSLRSSRLLLVLNSASPPIAPVPVSVQQEEGERQEEESGAEGGAAAEEDVEEPHIDDARSETLISVASAGAQYLGPALASLVQV
ncbi:hypothetical protein CF326_g2997 [Tilletia indica]|nr:hypothetical protein CF326_g2997 [Tilletia indica]